MMEHHKKSKAAIQKQLRGLLRQGAVSSPNDWVYREMMMNIGQLRSENYDVGDVRILNTALKELRYAMGVFRLYRSYPKAAVFGSARTPHRHSDYKQARHLGKKFAQNRWMVITGGASGIMEAAMVGAGSKNSFGLNIMLPFEQEANPIIEGNHKLMHFKYFFTRKLMFMKESDTTILFPGGFGTFDEGFECFTLVQTGKARPRPMILIDPPGSKYWKKTLVLLKENMENSGLISKGDLDLLTHVQSADEAVKVVLRFYSNYHSSRFFKGMYLIRLKKRLQKNQMTELNKRHKGILKHGHFECMDVCQDLDDPDPKLDRLVFNFNRSDYAGLKKLIDHLNTL